ncbi:hypothetical protein FJZ31_20170 [Candidatus Poribacteria bacterium]|nr:hypothetical protein [Candidatus Poribacteria bacterium]
MLGYILTAEDVLGYYGEERQDIQQAIFRYGEHRETVVVMQSSILGRGRGDGPGFRSPEQLLEIARMCLDDQESPVLRNYPAFHGTVGRYSPNGGIFRRTRALVGTDMVFDIDVKTNYQEAFRQGMRITDFLDRYDVPYRVKFSGGSGPHIILPYEVFPQPLSEAKFKRVFGLISTLSEAQKVDGSFSSPTHFLRLPYSLNENTGLASLPLNREQMESFEPGMAEIQNVEVDESWFELPEDAQERMEKFFVDGLGFKKIKRKSAVEDDCSMRREE